ncbi:Acb2/Tad1 domain-containing protein [Elizabethkingia anophelis]|uniref:Acb2/Tad1 domain-containing protein n=1 Tax=Elizabethkingia anophelis TaxID=1117645 RepID=UPI0038912153
MDKTIGQQRVRTDFSITKSDDISLIKQQTAHLIDMLESQRLNGSLPAVSEKQRLISIAQSKYEEAVMFAEKALTVDAPNIDIQHLVSFGNYVLSPQREAILRTKCVEDIDERRKHVHHADIENWKFHNTSK